MVDRRKVISGFGAASLAIAAATVGARTPSPDYFELFLKLIADWKRHDIDAVLARVSDDIVWYAYVGAPPVVGKPAMRKLLETIAPNRTAERWRIFFHAVNGERLFVEGVDDFDEKDHRVEVPYAGVVEFKDGLVVGWRDYFDNGLLKRMKDGEAVPAVIEPLVSRTGRP